MVEGLCVDDERVLPTDADLPGDRRCGERMVAGDHEDANAGGVAASDGVGDRGAGRVLHRDQPEKAEP